MYDFRNDYAEGAHPAILQRLLESNFEQHNGYGDDKYSVAAKTKIRQAIGQPDAAVYFIAGGTHANLIVIAALLRPYEAVISADSGHIVLREAGSVESTGHKVIAVPSADGKITPADIQQVLKEHAMAPHMVKPRLVYISNATETGTIYKKAELEALSACCKENGLYLFMDGARLGNALVASDNDVSFADIAHFTDVFYIGATKNGGLLGEAVVINNMALQEGFGYIVKQRGALLSKGRLLGIQFLELFSNDLFFTAARHANRMAMKIMEAVEENGYQMLTPTTTNQIFPVFPLKVIEELSKDFLFYTWRQIDATHAAVRIITSWATDEKQVDAFITALKEISE